MKDKYCEKIIKEFICLRSKMCSIYFSDGSEKKTAKGVSKVTINRDLRHTMYKETLTDKRLGLHPAVICTTLDRTNTSCLLYA